MKSIDFLSHTGHLLGFSFVQYECDVNRLSKKATMELINPDLNGYNGKMWAQRSKRMFVKKAFKVSLIS